MLLSSKQHLLLLLQRQASKLLPFFPAKEPVSKPSLERHVRPFPWPQGTSGQPDPAPGARMTQGRDLEMVYLCTKPAAG